MIYKTIAVILQGKEDTQRVLDFAIPLAQVWGAHIVGIHAEPIPVAYSAAVGFPDVAVIETATQAAEERTKEIEAMFSGRMKAAGQSHDWHGARSFSGDSGHACAAIARAADLVVAAQHNPNWVSDETTGIESVLYEAGRPVLVVPHSGALTSTFSRVLVAWNGSREVGPRRLRRPAADRGSGSHGGIRRRPARGRRRPVGKRVGAGGSTFAARSAGHRRDRHLPRPRRRRGDPRPGYIDRRGPAGSRRLQSLLAAPASFRRDNPHGPAIHADCLSDVTLRWSASRFRQDCCARPTQPAAKQEIRQEPCQKTHFAANPRCIPYLIHAPIRVKRSALADVSSGKSLSSLLGSVSP